MLLSFQLLALPTPSVITMLSSNTTLVLPAFNFIQIGHIIYIFLSVFFYLMLRA